MSTVKHVAKGAFEFIYVDGLVQYASLQKPKRAYKSEAMEYSMNLFILKEDVDALEAIPLNKIFFQVGVDKNKVKKIKYPIETHKEFEGLYGFGLHRPAVNKDGEPTFVTVIDKDRKPFKKLIGNGSKVKVKCYGWRTEEKLLTIAIDTVQVLDWVEFEESNEIFDDEFGGAYERRQNVPESSKPAYQDPESETSVDDDDDPNGDKY